MAYLAPTLLDLPSGSIDNTIAAEVTIVILMFE